MPPRTSTPKPRAKAPPKQKTPKRTKPVRAKPAAPPRLSRAHCRDPARNLCECGPCDGQRPSEALCWLGPQAPLPGLGQALARQVERTRERPRTKPRRLALRAELLAVLRFAVSVDRLTPDADTRAPRTAVRELRRRDLVYVSLTGVLCATWRGEQALRAHDVRARLAAREQLPLPEVP